MYKYLNLIFFVIISFTLVLTGFQCSSTELTSARLYIQQKNLDKAEKALNDEIKKNPQSEEGYFLLGYVNYEKKDYEAMSENFKKALAIDKKHESEINNYIKSAWGSSVNEGINIYNQAIKLEDKQKSEEMKLKAIEQVKRGIKILPDSSEPYRILGNWYLNLNMVDEAIEPLEFFVKKTNSLEGYDNLSQIFLFKAENLYAKYSSDKNIQDSLNAMDLYKKNITLLEKGTQTYPTDIELYKKLLRSYLMTGQKSVLLEKSKQAYEKNQNDKTASFIYGTLLLETQNYPDAEVVLKKSYELDSKNLDALTNLTQVYLQWGLKVREEETDKPDEQKTYKKYFEKAIPYYEKLVELKPDDSKLWNNLARVYTVLGIKDKAKTAFDKADQLSKEGK